MNEIKNKKIYTSAEAEIIEISCGDVVTASDGKTDNGFFGEEDNW